MNKENNKHAQDCKGENGVTCGCAHCQEKAESVIKGESVFNAYKQDFIKIIISAIVSGKIKVEMATAGEIPYAGLYITQKKQLSLDVAKEILEHEDFKKYIRQYGVPTTKDSYRISKKIVEEYFFEL